MWLLSGWMRNSGGWLLLVWIGISGLKVCIVECFCRCLVRFFMVGVLISVVIGKLML